MLVTPIENKALIEEAMFLLLGDGEEWSPCACSFQKEVYCFT
jgi:hypothetical protein